MQPTVWALPRGHWTNIFGLRSLLIIYLRHYEIIRTQKGLLSTQEKRKGILKIHQWNGPRQQSHIPKRWMGKKKWRDKWHQDNPQNHKAPISLSKTEMRDWIYKQTVSRPHITIELWPTHSSNLPRRPMSYVQYSHIPQRYWRFGFISPQKSEYGNKMNQIHFLISQCIYKLCLNNTVVY